MSDIHDDRRESGRKESGRREDIRRAYDLLDGEATEEERRALDSLLRRDFLINDRREQERRSGVDRRMEKETECPCTKTDCKRRGDCVECFKHHLSTGKAIFCHRPENVVPNDVRLRVLERLQAEGITVIHDKCL